MVRSGFSRRHVPVVALLVAVGCSSGALPPAELDTRHEGCAACRMTVSDGRFASQVVAPGEEAVFFDDLTCLTAYLRTHAPLPEGAVVYVADHRTKEWASASAAVYTRVDHLETPMGSHLVAHATTASRDEDPAAQGGVAVPAGQVLAGALEERR